MFRFFAKLKKEEELAQNCRCCNTLTSYQVFSTSHCCCALENYTHIYFFLLSLLGLSCLLACMGFEWGWQWGGSWIAIYTLLYCYFHGPRTSCKRKLKHCQVLLFFMIGQVYQRRFLSYLKVTFHELQSLGCKIERTPCTLFDFLLHEYGKKWAVNDAYPTMCCSKFLRGKSRLNRRRQLNAIFYIHRLVSVWRKIDVYQMSAYCVCNFLIFGWMCSALEKYARTGSIYQYTYSEFSIILCFENKAKSPANNYLPKIWQWSWVNCLSLRKALIKSIVYNVIAQPTFVG